MDEISSPPATDSGAPEPGVDKLFDPDWIVAPGRILAEELLLRALGEFSLMTGIARERLTGILDGTVEITKEDARVFYDVLGISATFWLRLEEDYQNGKARGKTPL